MFLETIDQPQPIALLRLGGECQMPHGDHIDLLRPIEAPDTGEQIADGEGPFHLKAGQPEGQADVLDAPPFADKPGEGFAAIHLVGIEAGDILDQRGFQCRRIVPGFDHRAGQRVDTVLFLGNGQRRIITPLASHDLKGSFGFARPDDQRHENTSRPDRRQNVGDVRLLGTPAHVGGRHDKLRQFDMTKFHDNLSFALPNHRGPG